MSERSPFGSTEQPTSARTAAMMFATTSASITTFGESFAAAKARSSAVRVMFGEGGRISGSDTRSASCTGLPFGRRVMADQKQPLAEQRYAREVCGKFVLQ